MRRALFTTLCTLAVVLLLHPANALAGPAWRSWDAGLREAEASGRPVLVDVTTDWCGWCKRMDQDVYARADVQGYLARKFVTVKLDAESDDAARYEGRAYTSRTLAARRRLPRTCSRPSNGAKPVEIEPVAMLIEALPVWAARSSVTLPMITSKRPREVEVPKCLISQWTWVLSGSIANSCGAACAMPAAPPAARASSSAPAFVITA